MGCLVKRKLSIMILCIIFASVIAGVGMPEKILAATKKAAVKTIEKKVIIKAGNKKTLKVKGSVKKYKWSSNKKKVVTVNNKGIINAKNKGRAVVTAKNKQRKYKFNITVKKATKKDKIPNRSETQKDEENKTLQYEDMGLSKEYIKHFFGVKQVKGDTVYLVPETGTQNINYKIKYSSDTVKTGSRIKLLNMVVNSTSDENGYFEITSYTYIEELEEGWWMTNSQYVEKIENGTLYLKSSPEGVVDLVCYLNHNEIDVFYNETHATFEDIKPGSVVSLFISGPIATSFPGQVIDCTMIKIVG